MNEHNNGKQIPIRIFTIGFAKKRASDFFKQLTEAGVKLVIDIRLNNVSQLAGFTKKKDIEYFLQAIANIEYIYQPDLAPTKDILNAYKKKHIDWHEYEKRFCNLMVQRHVENTLAPERMDGACFLCSESKPDKCHRRLVAEYLRVCWGNIIIRHL
jgi:uncharacterized protein (DUF488 family)